MRANVIFDILGSRIVDVDTKIHISSKRILDYISTKISHNCWLLGVHHTFFDPVYVLILARTPKLCVHVQLYLLSHIPTYRYFLLVLAKGGFRFRRIYFPNKNFNVFSPMLQLRKKISIHLYRKVI
jgi:hypothetical protein